MSSQADSTVSFGSSSPIGGGTGKPLADASWAWARYESTAQQPWDLALAAHLYRRAGFGADWKQLQQAVSDGPQLTVDRLLQPEGDVDAFHRAYDAHEDAAAGSVNGLRAWWLRRMIETPHPLLEKMTLFWHGYFATDGGAINQPRLMHEHIRLLRRHALGSFDSLLRRISRDPALLEWLGANANRKAAPSESFVRPLLETYTVGPGHFTDEDVREASRAFTGWFVLRNQVRYLPHEHDEGVKWVLGREGALAGDDVVETVLAHAATPQTVVRRLYRWLISETDEPDDALIAPLAESLAEDYNVSAVVETMLRSNLFFSRPSYRARVKCPVEFAVGIVKGFEGRVSTTQLASDVADLGQNLCHPPTVKGWKGGRHWLTTATIAGRHNLSLALLSEGEPYRGGLDPWRVAQGHGYTTLESAAQFLWDSCVQGDVPPGTLDALLRHARAATTDNDLAAGALLRRVAHAMVNLPEYYLA